MSFSAASLYAVLESSVPERAAGLVVALSGGADSAALLAGLAALMNQYLLAQGVHGSLDATTGDRTEKMALAIDRQM